MKKQWAIASIAPLVTAGLLCSCVSLQDKTMSPQERQDANVLGSVAVEWTSTNFLHAVDTDNMKSKAYAELKRIAQKKYPGNIDIKNISIEGSFSSWNLLWGMLYFVSPLLLNVQKITATGDVVSYGAAAAQANAVSQSNAVTQSHTQGAITGIEGALNRACESLINDLPKRTTVAVLSVSSRDGDMALFALDEIEFQLVDSREFDMVDRKTLDSIRTEQNFQMSGEVSDASAVSIGNLLGANIVITGSITGSGSMQRLTVKAMDVKTAKIIAMAREQF